MKFKLTSFQPCLLCRRPLETEGTRTYKRFPAEHVAEVGSLCMPCEMEYLAAPLLCSLANDGLIPTENAVRRQF